MGRPTRESAQARHEELLDGALVVFLEKGFDQTTIEAIVTATGITKRTIYRRHPDKRALFLATVQRALARWSIPRDTLAAAEVDDLEATLLAVARIRVASILNPAGLRLQRVINAESYRFPEIFRWYDEAISPTVEFLEDLFRRHQARGVFTGGSPEAATMTYLSIIGPATRAAILGQHTEQHVVDEQVGQRVRLLLHGLYRPQGSG